MLIKKISELNVLVVEQDEELRKSIVKYFKDFGVHSVSETHSLKLAHDSLSNSRVNLLTLHDSNEHMNALEFIYSVKCNNNMDILLILITS